MADRSEFQREIVDGKKEWWKVLDDAWGWTYKLVLPAQLGNRVSGLLGNFVVTSL